MPGCTLVNVAALFQDETNPGVAGAEEGPAAHVQIFQLWFTLFSLASSALLEPGPEKLSISHNSRLPLHPKLDRPLCPEDFPITRWRNNMMAITKSSSKHEKKKQCLWTQRFVPYWDFPNNTHDLSSQGRLADLGITCFSSQFPRPWFSSEISPRQLIWLAKQATFWHSAWGFSLKNLWLMFLHWHPCQRKTASRNNFKLHLRRKDGTCRSHAS